MKTIYRIPHPYSNAAQGACIEVFGEPDMGWYDWHVIDARGNITQSDETYGNPEIALRDALIYATKD